MEKCLLKISRTSKCHERRKSAGLEWNRDKYKMTDGWTNTFTPKKWTIFMRSFTFFGSAWQTDSLALWLIFVRDKYDDVGTAAHLVSSAVVLPSTSAAVEVCRCRNWCSASLTSHRHRGGMLQWPGRTRTHIHKQMQTIQDHSEPLRYLCFKSKCQKACCQLYQLRLSPPTFTS